MRHFAVRVAESFDLDDCFWFDSQSSASRSDSEKRLELATSVAARNVFLACDDDGRPVGYIRLGMLGPQLLPVLYWAFVKPDWRRKGVMSTLYDYMASQLVERGYERLIFSIPADCDGLMDIFKSRGLVEIGRLALAAEAPLDVFYTTPL